MQKILAIAGATASGKSKAAVELAKKLNYVMENKAEMRVIAAQGQKNALLNFTKEKNAEAISKIYQDVL